MHSCIHSFIHPSIHSTASNITFRKEGTVRWTHLVYKSCQLHNGWMTACLRERQNCWHNTDCEISCELCVSIMTLSQYTASIRAHLSIIYRLYRRGTQTADNINTVIEHWVRSTAAKTKGLD